MANISIIGSGFSGLSAACYLAAAGHEVHVYEKNSSAGGRARQFTTNNGFSFDMGPSWYWMPDVFEKFFADFGYKVSDFYKLELLNPAFDIVFNDEKITHIPQSFDELCHLFESIEVGSAEKLKQFMVEAEYKYSTAMEKLIYQPSIHFWEFINLDVIKGLFRLQIFNSFESHLQKYFNNEKLIALMQFPILFLGSTPDKTPALYSLMNYAGLKLGTWYPIGGFGTVVNAFVSLAEKLGVQFHFNSPVQAINCNKNKIHSIQVNDKIITCDAVVAAADYYHVENNLLTSNNRNYTNSYWEEKTLSPSAIVYYLGINRKLKSINHHTLFFDESLEKHAREIYDSPKHPTNPLFYMCCPSVSDATVAPANHENIFLLIPIAPDLKDNEEIREKYFNMMLKRIENKLGEKIQENIIYKKSYSINNYISDYNSYKGNAYGLANTLFQTAFLKPQMTNKKIRNLIYAGQLTVPGPGVPPAIISGKIAAELLIKKLK